MARVQVNFAEVQGFEAVPEDEYSVIIEKAEWREAQEEGKFDYINVTLRITEGEQKDRNVFMIWSFSPKALWRMKDDLVNLEVVGPDDELDFEYDEETMELTEPAVVGLPAKAVVTQREYEGRTQNQVENLMPLPKAPQKKAPAGTAAKKKPAGTTRSTRASSGTKAARNFK